jgi:hypothetical protein
MKTKIEFNNFKKDNQTRTLGYDSCRQQSVQLECGELKIAKEENQRQNTKLHFSQKRNCNFFLNLASEQCMKNYT